MRCGASQSDQGIGLFLKLIESLSAVEVNLCKVFIGELRLLDGPTGQNVVEGVETDCFIWVNFGPVFLNIKGFDEFAVHEEQQVETLNIWCDVHLSEVRIEFLQSKVLEDFLTLGDEETTNFLDSALLLKQFSILQLDSMLRVVSHQVLCQEDAWIEPCANASIDFICEKT